MGQPVCIYCKATAPEAAFDREHVLQQGFGHFREALVLHGAVCTVCNGHFSGTIDLALTRDSMEGLERYRWGIKTPEEVERFLYRNLVLRAQDMGDFSGAQIRLGPGDSERPFTAEIVPSAVIRKRGSDSFVPFSEAQILSGEWNNETVDHTRGVKLFGPEDATTRMQLALEQQGVTLTYQPLRFKEPNQETTQVEHEFTISLEVKRALAKVAFNYLAYRTDPTYVLAPAFEPIRRFIRYGEEPPLPPVETTNDVPFATPESEEGVPVVHWISLESHRYHRNLLSVITLFSVQRHTVVLAEDFPGPWFDLPVAHLYNPKTLTVSEHEPVKPRWKHEDRAT